MMNIAALTAFAENMLFDHSVTLLEDDGRHIEHFRLSSNANLLADLVLAREKVRLKVFYGNSDWYHGDIVFRKANSSHEQLVIIDTYGNRVATLIPDRYKITAA